MRSAAARLTADPSLGVTHRLSKGGLCGLFMISLGQLLQTINCQQNK